MGINESFANDQIADLALREPVCCRPDDDIESAIQRLRDRNLGCLIVVDHKHKPIGVVTESMITQKVAHDPASISGPVQGLMADICPWVQLTDSVSLVLDAMQAQNTRFLCVVDDDGRTVGLTGQKGLMEFIADHYPQQVMVQRVGSLPPKNREGA
ncbi:MAG: CBS domain-containing protein [Bythopirellula sp.]